MAVAIGPCSAPAITDVEFTRFQALIQRESGIYLGPGKEVLLVGRLMGRLRALGLESFGEYYFHVLDDEAELVELFNRICTNETSFFREPQQFELLRKQIFPGWLAEGSAGRRSKRIRVWSAGCSTGEEPYSLAMVLLESFPPAKGWEFEIHATDLSMAALERARTSIWTCEQAEQIPPRLLKRFMLRGIDSREGMMRASPELRSLLRFRHLNLADESYDMPGPFDLILCRNVLIYFETAARLRATDRLLDRLAPEGLLLLGHAESLNGVTNRGRSLVPTVYRLANGAASCGEDAAGGARPLGASSVRGDRK